MSLKVFHVIFIILAVLMCVGCAAWSFLYSSAPAFGVACAVIAVVLLVYGVWFLKKSNKIIT